MTNQKEKIELLIKVFDNQQTLISNTDTKSNISLSLQTFILTAVLGTSIIVDTFNNVLGYSCLMRILYFSFFISFIITSILGLAYCILVFKPRPPQEKKETKRMGITYFGHIIKYKNSDAYLEAFNDIKSAEIIKEFAFQNYNLAVILEQKMKYIKLSTTLLFINILIGMTLFLFSLIIK